MSDVDLESVPTPVGRGEAVGLAVIAGLLLLIEGGYLFFLVVALPFGSVPLDLAGACSIVGGVALLILAFAYRVRPGARSSVGPMVVVISAGALWFGGGFLVGTFLGLAAGVFMIVLPIYWDR